MMIIHISSEDFEILCDIFAYYHKGIWLIPAWLETIAICQGYYLP